MLVTIDLSRRLYRGIIFAWKVGEDRIVLSSEQQHDDIMADGVPHHQHDDSGADGVPRHRTSIMVRLMVCHIINMLMVCVMACQMMWPTSSTC